MASKTFMTLSKKECLTHYRKVLETSDSNWKSGLILAKEQQYGNAMSMAIISSEELVKALIILLDGRGFEFRSVQGMDALFANHQIRYVILYVMLAVSLSTDEMKEYLGKLKADPVAGFSFVNQITTNDPTALNKLQGYGLELLARLGREFEWFAKVDVYRQQGFYSDYDEQLKTPIEIDSTTYQEALTRLEKVRVVGLGLIETLASSEDLYVNHFTHMRRNLKQNKVYQKIAASLATLRQTRENPFVVIKQYFERNTLRH